MQTPAILKPLELWTGKQAFNMLLRPSAAVPLFVNLERIEKGYTAGESLCPNDGFVCIVNSELVCGRAGKALLGGDKSGLFSVLAARASPAVAGAPPLNACCLRGFAFTCLPLLGGVKSGLFSVLAACASPAVAGAPPINCFQAFLPCSVCAQRARRPPSPVRLPSSVLALWHRSHLFGAAGLLHGRRECPPAFRVVYSEGSCNLRNTQL